MDGSDPYDRSEIRTEPLSTRQRDTLRVRPTHRQSTRTRVGVEVQTVQADRADPLLVH
jgi:hypothetical protein